MRDKTERFQSHQCLVIVKRCGKSVIASVGGRISCSLISEVAGKGSESVWTVASSGTVAARHIEIRNTGICWTDKMMQSVTDISKQVPPTRLVGCLQSNIHIQYGCGYCLFSCSQGQTDIPERRSASSDIVNTFGLPCGCWFWSCLHTLCNALTFSRP